MLEFSNLVAVFFSNYGEIVGPIAAVAFVSAVLANLLQVGVLFTTKAIAPNIGIISINKTKG